MKSINREIKGIKKCDLIFGSVRMSNIIVQIHFKNVNEFQNVQSAVFLHWLVHVSCGHKILSATSHTEVSVKYTF